MKPEPYYQDDWATIYHGDNREVLPSLGPVDLVFTSPPYNLGVTAGGGFGHYADDAGMRQRSGGGKWTGGKLATGYEDHDDAMPFPEYEEWQRWVIAECWRLTAPFGAIFYNHKPRVQAAELWSPQRLIPDGVVLRQIITWARAGGINFAPTHYLPTCEWIMLLAHPEWRLKSKGASGIGDVWRVAQESGTAHPAPFPLALPAMAIESAGPSLVLDPHAGSGTTMRAAKDAGVRSIGIEKSERYCEIAAKRLAQEVLDFGGAA